MDNVLRPLSLGVALGASLLLPMSAFAYLTPDQVFGGSSTVQAPTSPMVATPPPTQREGEDVVSLQQQQAASQRQEAQQNLRPIDAEPVDTYVPDQSPKVRDLLNSDTQYQIRQQRIEQQHAAAPTIIIGGDTTVTDANGNVLHSGAPRVSTTGPETMLAMLAMMLAGLCTFAYAYMRRRMLVALV